jgi:peptidoglycan/xylan/chitin deacetylase (PgdA/CDA1 family)
MKPLASLSLDLDNEWAYVKTHGDPAWEAFPSYFDVFVPRFLDIFARLKQRITVFVVGQDAVLEKNANALRAIVAAGHEIGNHSFHHEPWLPSNPPGDIDKEIVAATEAIVAATGVRPIGFRGPGYSLSRPILETLAKHGYRYDCSTFPTYVGPLARAYYFMTAKLTAEERAKRKELFGSITDGLRPLRAYRWNLGPASLIEIPVTTFPLLKIPIHFSYILYIATRSPALALAYFRTALGACRLAGIAPSLLLHPLDFLDVSDVPSLAFFPAMNLKREVKLAVLVEALEIYCATFDVVPVGEHAASAEAATLRAREAVFA